MSGDDELQRILSGESSVEIEDYLEQQAAAIVRREQQQTCEKAFNALVEARAAELRTHKSTFGSDLFDRVNDFKAKYTGSSYQQSQAH